MTDIADNAVDATENATDTVAEHVNQGTESIAQGADHLTKAVEDLMGIVRINAEHIGAMAEHMSKLQPIEAVQEVPAAAADTVEEAGTTGGETLEGAADIVASPAKVVTRKKKKFGRR